MTLGTVTSQLLYEIAGPEYLGPDVTARFDSIRLDQIDVDRVRISGVRGQAPPDRLKVAMNEVGGYRNEFSIALTGLDIDAKAALAQRAFWDACPHSPADFAEVTSEVIRTDTPDPPTQEAATAQWRLTVKDPDERRVGRAFSDAMIHTALASIPGLYALTGGPSGARPYGVYRPASIGAELVPQYVHVLGRGSAVVDPVPRPAVAPAPDGSDPVLEAGVPVGGPTIDRPLGELIGARSGDKGGNANVGVFARTDAAWAWVDGFLDTDRLRTLLPETASFAITRHRLPNLLALNFVIHGLLQEGVAASTRTDAQAKALGEWLRARVVPIPAGLLDRS